MEKLFKLKAHGTDVKTEIRAGITTFFAMAYIIFVNSNYLSMTGMNKTGVMVATCISAAIGCLLTAFLANVPFCQAPGMGLNTFFTFTVCFGMGYTWEQALAIVFISGVLFLVVTVSPLRKKIIEAIPASLKAAISAGIGFFIALIGMFNVNIVTAFGTGIAGAYTDMGSITKGAALLALIAGKRWTRFTRDYLWRGAVIGGMLFLAYSIQTFGLARTTPSKNAFLTAVYCVIVPFLYWFIAKRRPDRFNLIAAFLCIGGIALVSITGDNASAFNMGDVLTLIGGFFFAAHIVAVSRYSEGRDIFILTTLQFASFALFSWLGVLITRPALTPGVFDSSLIMGLAYLVICASCGALLFQNIGQKYTAPSTAAVLLSLEAPFGVFFSILFANERPTPLMFVGFALIFIAVVCSETKFSFLRKKKS